MHRPLARLALALFLLTGCGDPGLAVDGGARDAGWVDAGSVDAGSRDDAGAAEDAGASEDAGRGEDAGESEDAGAEPADAGLPDSGAPDSGAPDSGSPDSGSPDAGSPDAGSPDAGIDSGSPDSGSADAGIDSGPADPCTPLPSGLTTWTRSDSASSGTPDSYVLDVSPGDPFCASITGGGGGTWWVNVSNGTSSGVYCYGDPTCSILVPAGQTALMVTAVTDDIGYYTLTVRYRPR